MNLDKARWIWASDAPDGMQVQSFCTTFETTVPQVTLELSCDTNCSIFLNGSFIGIAGLSDYPDRKIYDTLTLPITKQQNTLVITVYHEGRSSSCYRLGTPCLKFAVSDGETILCRSDENTRCANETGYQRNGVQLITGQLGYSFCYEETAVRFDRRSTVLDMDPPLLPRPIQPLSVLLPAPAHITAQGVFLDDPSIADPGRRMQTAFLSARSLWDICGTHQAPVLLGENGCSFAAEDGNGIYLIVDLGKESVGLFTLDIELPKQTQIDIGWGEHLGDLRTRTSVGGRSFAAELTLQPGRKRFTHYFRRLGLRYLQLHIHCHAFTIYYAGILPTEYPVNIRPVRRKDALEQKIVDCCITTLRHCMHDHYEDCPWREQALYTMDSRNQMLCGYYCFDNPEFARYSLQLIAHSLRERDRMLELCSPADIPITIPSFTLIFLKQLEEYLLYTKDEPTVKELFATGQQIIDGFIARTEDNGLLKTIPGDEMWNYYEWQTGLESDRSIHALDNAYAAPLCGYYGIALQSGIQLAEHFNLTEKAAQYKAAYNQLQANTHNLFWDENAGYYQSYVTADGKRTDHFAALTGALLLYAGLVPENKASLVREKLYQNNGIHPITLSHSIFRYEALLQDQNYAPAIKAEIQDIWGKMLFAGSDTFWETADGAWAFDNAGSLCHGWSAVPLYIYAKYRLEEEND